MKLWKDSTGKDWTLLLDLPAEKRIHDLAGVDLRDAEQLQKLFTPAGVAGLVAVFFATLQPQLAAAGVDADQFSARVHGAFRALKAAWLEELRDFFHEYEDDATAVILDRVLTVLRTKQRATIDLATDPAIDETTERAVDHARHRLRNELASLATGAK